MKGEAEIVVRVGLKNIYFLKKSGYLQLNRASIKLNLESATWILLKLVPFEAMSSIKPESRNMSPSI